MRSFAEKMQSTKLHQAWAIILGSTLLLVWGFITPEIWLGAQALGFGGYSYANVQQHRIYSSQNGSDLPPGVRP